MNKPDTPLKTLHAADSKLSSILITMFFALCGAVGLWELIVGWSYMDGLERLLGVFIVITSFTVVALTAIGYVKKIKTAKQAAEQISQVKTPVH